MVYNISGIHRFFNKDLHIALKLEGGILQLIRFEQKMQYKSYDEPKISIPYREMELLN